jgi:hypothetical protein
MKAQFPVPFRQPFLLFIATLALGTSLRAATVMTGEQSQPDGSTITSTVTLDEGRARMQSDANGQETIMIYRSDKNLFWIMDTVEKNYREVTKAHVAAMVEQVDKAMQLMQEKLKDLPPDQRAMAEKMLGGAMAAAGQKSAAPKTSYEKVGPGGKVGEWTTEKYIATTDGEKKAELWVAPISAVKVDEADMKTMEEMTDFLKEISGRFGADMMPSIGPDSELGGMPVKVITFRDGQPISTYVVKSIEQKNLPTSTFEVPEGFTKQDLGIPKG